MTLLAHSLHGQLSPALSYLIASTGGGDAWDSGGLGSALDTDTPVSGTVLARLHSGAAENISISLVWACSSPSLFFLAQNSKQVM